MSGVFITSVAVAQPDHWIEQDEAGRRIGDATGHERRVAAIVKGSQIERRALALPPDDIARLASIGQRNQVYRLVAPRIAIRAAADAIEAHPPETIGCVITSSCTGYMVPGWDVDLVQALGLPLDAARLPITEAGCAGGVVALARTADYLRLHPDRAALAVAAELCSLAFHPQGDLGNLTSALIFGDGAGAALLQASAANDGLEIVDGLSLLLPCSQAALGFELTDNGFYPLLTRELADILPSPTLAGARRLLGRHGLDETGISYLLVHPGGPRILSSLAAAFRVSSDDLRWSWSSLRELGNTSSAAIFDVIRRYLKDDAAPRGWGLVVAFGPGVSIEMLLVHRC